MGYISYVAAAGASLVAGLIMWWAFDRYQSRLARCLFCAVAILLSFIVYFVFGLLILIPVLTATSSEASEAGVALGHGIKILTTMLLVVTAFALSIRGRAKVGTPTENRPL